MVTTPETTLALAVSLHLQGDYAGARIQCERALALPQTREDIAADLWDVLGSAQRDEGDLESARMSYAQALEVRQRLYSRQSPQVATSLSNLGVLEQRGGRSAEAIGLLGEAVLLLSQEHGDIYPEVGRATVNLGIAHAAAGNLDGARANFQHAATILQATLGGNHADVRRALDGLASVYLLTGNRDEARKLFAQAVRILSETIGPDHPHTAGSRAKLIQADTPKLAEPEMEQREKELRTRVGRPQTDFQVESVWDLTAALAIQVAEKGDVKGAEAILRQCVLSGDLRSAPRAALNLGLLFKQQGDLNGADVAFIRALESDDLEVVGRAGLNLGKMRLERDDRKGALAAFEGVADVGPSAWRPVAQMSLGVLLEADGQWHEAQRLYEMAAVSDDKEMANRAKAALHALATRSTSAKPWWKLW